MAIRPSLAALGALALVVVVANARTLGFVFWMDSFDHLRMHVNVQTIAALGLFWGDRRYLRPVWLATLLPLKRLFGAEPLGYHVAILALHVLTGALLYAVTHRLTERRDLALMTTAIWVALGWNAYTVSWAGPLVPELIAAPAAMAALVFFWEGLRRVSRLGTLAATFAFVVAVLSKESVLPFAGLFTIVAWRHFGLPAGEAFRRTSPFWMVIAGYAVLRLAVFGAEALPLKLSGVPVPWLSGRPEHLAIGIATFALNYARQLVFLVLPVPMIPLDGLGMAFVAAATLVFAGLGRLGGQRTRPEPARQLARFGVLWCLILASPYAFASHPRVLYQVGMGLAMVLAAGIHTVVVGRWRTAAVPVSATLALFVYLALHAVIGWRLQDNYAPGSPSTLAIYANNHIRMAGIAPDDAFDVALRDHVRDHLARYGCLSGDEVVTRCRARPTYDLNDLLPRYRLGLLLPFVPGTP